MQHFSVFSGGYVLFFKKVNQKEKDLGSGNRENNTRIPKMMGKGNLRKAAAAQVRKQLVHIGESKTVPK